MRFIYLSSDVCSSDLSFASPLPSVARSGSDSSQSSSGLLSTASLISDSSSSADSCSRCSAWRSCGVRTSCWPSDVWRRGFIFPCGAPRATVGNGVHLQAEGVPQVDATHVRIGQQRVRSTLREHAAFAEDIRPVELGGDSFREGVCQNE